LTIHGDLCRTEEDGLRVVIVENLRNPYEGNLGGINKRFKLTLNKLYAWTLVDYERVVMIDSDNIFLQNTDELFQCGQFCAVFINPCYFHTGLFVLQVCPKLFVVPLVTCPIQPKFASFCLKSSGFIDLTMSYKTYLV